MLRALVVVLFLAANPLHAQAPGEISFWESVRDTKNPAELRAYLQQYPNGIFKALADARLATLEKPAPAARPPAPAVTASPPAAAPMSAARMPQAGDSWTYRLSYPRVRGQWGQADRAPATHVVTIGEAKDGKIVDLLSVDGGSQTSTSHSKGVYLVSQGVSILSPYLVAFRDLASARSVGTVTILDTPCSGSFGCRATGKVQGRETISVPAGQFNAIKVLIEENWWPASAGVGNATLGRMNGGRTLTVWYSPEIKRAVKFASRITVGDIPAVEPTFDLELVSYQVK
jgi:hypothetical protein